jgi:hypothetical protein
MTDEAKPSAARNDKSDADQSGFDALLRAATGSGAAGARPVEDWNPPYCGDIGLRIRRDGTWTYQESPIGRIALVKLFASILRKDEDGRTYLVTPVEKIGIDVEDAPFLAVEMAARGEGRDQQLTFRTNVDDVVTVDRDHPIRFEREKPDGGLKPYVRVRGRLEALCTRSVYAELVGLAEPRDGDASDAVGVWSGGVWWGMG